MKRLIVLLVLLSTLALFADPAKHPVPAGFVNHAHLYKLPPRTVGCFFDNAVQPKDYIEVSAQWFGYCHSSGNVKTDNSFGQAVKLYPNQSALWLVSVFDTTKQ